MKQNPVVHFELPAKDKERMKKFYSGVFGWEMNQMGEEMGNYTVVMTTESDNNGPLKKGIINGGFYDLNEVMSAHPSFVISVDNIDEHMDKIKNGGGVIKGVPQDIPGVGKYVPFVDSEGNMLSILQPASEMGGGESSSNSRKKIIVRETFRAKPGQAGKLAKLFKKMMVAYPECRVMTDFIGEYNTVVIEMPVASLAEFEEEMKKMKSGDMGDMTADVIEEMKHYHEMFIEGKREVFEVV